MQAECAVTMVELLAESMARRVAVKVLPSGGTRSSSERPYNEFQKGDPARRDA